MSRASTPSWGLLGSAKHWAKTWKLGINKVQRDVGNSACGPALQRGTRKISQSLGPKKATWQGHAAATALSSSTLLPKCPAAWPTHHTEQSPFVEGWMESDELCLGPRLPLDNAARKQLKHGAVSSAKKEDDWFPILDPWISFHEHSQTLPTGVPDHGVGFSPKSFLSIWCLYCCLRQIRHDGG